MAVAVELPPAAGEAVVPDIALALAAAFCADTL